MLTIPSREQRFGEDDGWRNIFFIFTKINSIVCLTTKPSRTGSANTLPLPGLDIEEKEMFRGLTFMINGKMCISVSGDDLMVRFDPALQDVLSEKNGFREMRMKTRLYKGYGYIAPEAIRSGKAFDFWMQQCLSFNPAAKASPKKKR